MADGHFELPEEVRRQFPILTGLSAVILVVVVISYALRLYVKLGILKSFRSDDWALLLAFLLFLPLNVIGFLFAEWGEKLAEGDFSVLPPITTAAKVFNSVYALCAIACKISVALLVRSLLGPHDLWQRWLAIGVTSTSSLLGFLFFGFSFTCGITNISKTGGSCSLTTTANGISLAWSISNMVADVAFALLFVGLIWRASMSLRTRIVASLLLSFSSVGAVVSVLRVAALLGVGWKSFDAQRLIVTRWSLLEAGICVAAICLSSLRPLIRKIAKNGSSYGATDQGPTGSKTGPSRGLSQNKTKDGIPMKIGVKTVVEFDEGALLAEERNQPAWEREQV